MSRLFDLGRRNRNGRSLKVSECDLGLQLVRYDTDNYSHVYFISQ